MLLNAANNALHDAGHAESCRITEVCKTYSHLNNLDPNEESCRITEVCKTYSHLKNLDPPTVVYDSKETDGCSFWKVLVKVLHV